MARKPIGSGRRARRHDPDWEPPIPGRRRVLKTWDEYMTLAKRVVGRFHDKFELRHFDYWHPKRLQRRVAARFRKPYPVKVAYSDWGNPKNPTIVCCGGVANTAMRFNYLAGDLMSDFRVICFDWVGRGLSAWMSDETDYSLQTYVEQLRQMIVHLECGPVIVLGSSLGGSAAIELTAKHPALVSRLILNDIGPFIPKNRRKRRSQNGSWVTTGGTTARCSWPTPLASYLPSVGRSQESMRWPARASISALPTVTISSCEPDRSEPLTSSSSKVRSSTGESSFRTTRTRNIGRPAIRCNI